VHDRDRSGKIARVHADPDMLRQQLADLAERLAGREALIESMRAEILRLRRWRFGASSEVIDPGVAPQLPLAGGQVAAACSFAPSNEPVQKPPRLVSVDTPRPMRAERRALRELPEYLPRIVQMHEPESCQCDCCGRTMRRLGEDASEQLDYVPGYFRVIRHVRPKLACVRCARIVQAAAPMRPIERALPTPALLAQVISAKYADHCPLYRQEGIYRRSGVELPRSMLASWAAQTAELLDPLTSALERYVMSANKLHADDTPVPVLAPGLGKTRIARLWAYVRDDRPAAGPDPPAVIYRYSPNRKGEHPQAHLARFAGTLQADGYGGFGPLYENGRIVEAACWAHARRKFFDVYTIDKSQIAFEAMQRIAELYAIERQIRGSPPEVRLAARRERSVPILTQLRVWLNTALRALSVKSSLASAIQYALARWSALNRFTVDGRVEIDNNAAERAIRALVLGRRNYLFAGADSGGETAARLYSLIGTCRLNSIDPHAYLQVVLERIASHPINRIEDLLPWRLAPELLAKRQKAA
jgi:transposase